MGKATTLPATELLLPSLRSAAAPVDDKTRQAASLPVCIPEHNKEFAGP
ncbi:MAG: hypothetical protein WBD25_16245 [Terriglobales bacterium]